MRNLVVIALIMSSSFAADAKILIQCQAKDGTDLVVSLHDHKAFGHILNCVTRSDFIADMTPCAPDDGFGLSAPTGTAPLVAVVDRWQELSTHMGGAAAFGINADSIMFSGGYNNMGKYGEDWSIKIDRLTGKATLKQKDKPDAAFSCARAKAKL